MSKSNKTSNWVKKHSQDPFVKKSIQEKLDICISTGKGKAHRFWMQKIKIKY